MTALDLSSDVAIVAVFVLTLNLLLGLLLSLRYNPWTHWPHRRFNYFRIHNWTGYVALVLVILHPVLILASSTAGFGVVDLLYPVHAPRQPWINTVGAASLYVLVAVVVTSYYRSAIGRDRWKVLHYGAFVAAALFFVHGVWSDPTLKDAPIDYLDGEKVGIEICFLLVVAASGFRVWRGITRASWMRR
jgi:predicted ferric reductase